MLRTCAIVPAAGRGLRMKKGKPKQFLELLGKPILVHTLDVLAKVSFITDTYLVVPEDFLEATAELLKGYCSRHEKFLFQGVISDAGADSCHGAPRTGVLSSKTPESVHCITVVVGGAERQDSVYNALRILPCDCDCVLIHDGVRPFASTHLFEKTWNAARRTGAAIAALVATDTVKRVEQEQVLETLAREQIWLVQTPQVFHAAIILKAYREARRHGWSATDDASLVERLNVPVTVIQGERSNIKVTTREDLDWAEWFLNRHRE